MRRISASEVINGITAAVRRAATTLAPDRAIQIECAWEAEANAETAAALKKRIDHFFTCAENALPLRSDVREAVVFVSAGSEITVSREEIEEICAAGVRTAESGIETTVYQTAAPGDVLRIELALLDERTKRREQIIKTELKPGDLRFDKEVVSAVMDCTPVDAVPVILGIGVAAEPEAARRAARRAVMRLGCKKSPDVKTAEYERRILARLNNAGKVRHTAVSAALECRGAGYVCILPADCFTCLVSFEI